jgi:phosphopantetheinyl transferase
MDTLTLNNFLANPVFVERENHSVVIVDLPKQSVPVEVFNFLSATELSDPRLQSSESAPVSRALTRYCLSLQTGFPAKDLQIHRSNNGKPTLLKSNLSFSISHSGTLWAFASSSSHEVAIDLEVIKDPPRLLRIASRFFFESEKTYLQGLPTELAESAALQMWTAKEALVKLHGKTLFQGLPEYEIQLDPFVCKKFPTVHLQTIVNSRYMASIALDLRVQKN